MLASLRSPVVLQQNENTEEDRITRLRKIVVAPVAKTLPKQTAQISVNFGEEKGVAAYHVVVHFLPLQGGRSRIVVCKLL